jgi:hypothetical protein
VDADMIGAIASLLTAAAGLATVLLGGKRTSE